MAKIYNNNKKSDKFIIYTDACCSPNPGRGSYSVVILKNGNIFMELYGCFKETTSNRMKLMACLLGLQALNAQRQKSTVILYSDCKYVIDSINNGYVEKWEANGWRNSKGKRITDNPDLWSKMLDLLRKKDVTVEYLNKKSGGDWSKICHNLAMQAMSNKDNPADIGYEQRDTLPFPVPDSLKSLKKIF